MWVQIPLGTRWHILNWRNWKTTSGLSIVSLLLFFNPESPPAPLCWSFTLSYTLVSDKQQQSSQSFSYIKVWTPVPPLSRSKKLHKYIAKICKFVFFSFSLSNYIVSSLRSWKNCQVLKENWTNNLMHQSQASSNLNYLSWWDRDSFSCFSFTPCI